MTSTLSTELDSVGTPPPVALTAHEGLEGSITRAPPVGLQRLARLSLNSRWVNLTHISHMDPGDINIRVDATTAVSKAALDTATKIIHLMTMSMPPPIFTRLATGPVTVGVFTAAETLTVYPSYYPNSNPPECCQEDYNCCGGSCARSCTFDGRKWINVAGAGGQRTAVLDVNVLCTAADPYRGSLNVLVHEFAHTVHEYGLDTGMKKRLLSAYTAVRNRRLWNDTYAMANAMEYFAVGTSVFFNSDHRIENLNGPHIRCVSTSCSTGNAGKALLRNRDVTLYDIINEVFADNNSNDINIGTCTK
ncbi:uncharacterized protein LOC128235652 [Mya arenaria]|uniref:uncharacterized protein LOC128235652 n=1 Tax=Mya arenaria TaxID=6604 RepID=UPI0022E27101|nr:uncharacterized protein LOC128235652 [Mya arenaria]